MCKAGKVGLIVSSEIFNMGTANRVVNLGFTMISLDLKQLLACCQTDSARHRPVIVLPNCNFNSSFRIFLHTRYNWFRNYSFELMKTDI